LRKLVRNRKRAKLPLESGSAPMNTFIQAYEVALERICTETVSAAAPAVDRDGSFPRQAIDALKGAGFLGAMSAPEVGGLGFGLRGAARIVERAAEECGSTAMVLCMHYSGVAVLEAHAPEDIRRAAAAGDHLSTLAFSEAGSRSHFWAPESTAAARNGHIALHARKSWVTSASNATAYVWSSKPLDADGLSTIWLVPANSAGISVQGRFTGLGLRGNDSCPVSADGVSVPRSAMLGPDGKGFDVMMGVTLPVFSVLNAACSVGLMNGAVTRAARHVSATRHSDTASSLADLPTIRNYVARMRVLTDMAGALLQDSISAIESGRPDTMLRVLECKAAAGEASTEVTDLAMRICGGAAYRQEVGVERYFRDARAAGVMAPTTDVLYDFIGKAVCGLPLF
jgi:alkylation response protein AidB-like acyl-CoA dehydrogenase